MIRDASLDLALNDIATNTNRMYLCSQLPTTFAEAATTYNLAVKAGPTISSAQAHSGGGRELAVSAISDGVVSLSGTAMAYAFCNLTSSTLYAAKAVSATAGTAISTAAAWTCAAFTLSIAEL